MAEIIESYTTGNDAPDVTTGVVWYAQTFTLGNTGRNTDYNLNGIKLLMKKAVISEDFNFNIILRAVDVDGKPTGSDLSSGSILQSKMETGDTWIRINMTSFEMKAETKYAIIFNYPNGAGDVRVQLDESSSTYTGGTKYFSINSGSTWTIQDKDYMFEVLGTELFKGTISEKELKTNWPNEEGLTARTQKQTGREMNLIPQGLHGIRTVVLERDRELM